jgi:hypothetical protein
MENDPRQPRSGGDPLRAMYLLATLLMAAACVVVVVLMFVPGDRVAASGDDVWTPGSLPSYEAPAPPDESAAIPAEVREELHLH